MNAPQFDLNAMLSAPVQTAVQQIPCDQLHPFHDHKFELYSGERLEDMVESIRENGVLSPIIAQPDGDGYEILIGHNRWNASKLAGLTTVPVIVKTGLTDEEALLYTVESNLMQRGFDNLKISEQAAAIALRHSEMFSQGKRTDIIRELQRLDGTLDETLCLIDTKIDSNKQIADDYGMSRRSVARLLRIDKLIKPLKKQLDEAIIGTYAAVELSYLSEATQEIVAECTESDGINIKTAKKLREAAESDGYIDRNTVHSIIYPDKEDSKSNEKSVKISTSTYTKYFKRGTKPKEITETIEKALEFYFKNMT